MTKLRELYITTDQKARCDRILRTKSRYAGHLARKEDVCPDCVERLIAMFDDGTQVHVNIMAHYDDRLPYVRLDLYQNNRVMRSLRQGRELRQEYAIRHRDVNYIVSIIEH